MAFVFRRVFVRLEIANVVVVAFWSAVFPVSVDDAEVRPPLKLRRVEVAFDGKRYAKLPVVHDCGMTEPFELMVRHCPAEVPSEVMASEVDVALPRFAVVENKFPAVRAVEEA